MSCTINAFAISFRNQEFPWLQEKVWSISLCWLSEYSFDLWKIIRNLFTWRLGHKARSPDVWKNQYILKLSASLKDNSSSFAPATCLALKIRHKITQTLVVKKLIHNSMWSAQHSVKCKKKWFPTVDRPTLRLTDCSERQLVPFLYNFHFNLMLSNFFSVRSSSVLFLPLSLPMEKKCFRPDFQKKQEGFFWFSFQFSLLFLPQAPHLWLKNC